MNLKALALTPLVSLTIALATSAQNPLWVRHYGNSNLNFGLKLAYDGQGGLYGVGTAAQQSLQLDDETLTIFGSTDALLVRWDTLGNVIWARNAGGQCFPGDNDGGRLVAFDALSDHVIMSGQFNCPNSTFGSHSLDGPGSGSTAAFLATYDDAGECLWARSIDGSDASVNGLLVDQSSNIFVIGMAPTSGAVLHGSPDIALPPGGFIGKYDADGNLISAEQVVVAGDLIRGDWVDDERWALAGAIGPSGTIYGQSVTITSSVRDGFVAQSDTTGLIDWITMFQSNGQARMVFSLAAASNKTAAVGYFIDDLLLPSDTLYGVPGVWSYFVAMLDANGEVGWVVPVTSANGAYILDAKVDEEGNVILYGQYSGQLTIGTVTIEPISASSGFTARIASTGECTGAWNFGPISFGSGSILATNHGLYLSTEYDSTLVLGDTLVPHSSNILGYSDLLLARFDSLSGFSNVPSAMVLDGELLIYANPNNGLCTIDLPDAIVPGSAMHLRIYGNTGQLVQEVPVQLTEQGTVRLDIQAQAKGIYHVELVQGRQRYSGRIVFE